MAFDDDISQRLEALAAIAKQYEESKAQKVRRVLGQAMDYSLWWIKPDEDERPKAKLTVFEKKKPE